MPLRYVYTGALQSGPGELFPQPPHPSLKLPTSIQPAIFASDDAAFAAIHAFDWRHAEGFALKFENNTLVFEIPEDFQHKVKQKIYMYTLDASVFRELPFPPEGKIFTCSRSVKPLRVEAFMTVKDAILRYGGKMRMVD